jgi:hypothetical protein
VGKPMKFHGEDAVAFIKHHLVVLASEVNINPDLGLKPHQLQNIAQNIFTAFQFDSIQDVALCLRRGSSGFYGQIYRLDGAVIMDWFRAYLEEKYQLIEDERKAKAEEEKLYFNVDYEAFKKRAQEKAEILKAQKLNELLGEAEAVDFRKTYKAPDLEKYVEEKSLKLQWIAECTHPHTGKILPGKDDFETWKMNRK